MRTAHVQHVAETNVFPQRLPAVLASFWIALRAISSNAVLMDFVNWWRGDSKFATRSRTERAIVAMALLASVRFAVGIEPSDLLVYTVGPVSLRPQATAVAEFNNNIFYRQTNVVSDVIFAISPGIRMILGEDLLQQNHIAIRYSLERDFYLDNPQLNATQHRVALDGYFSTTRTTIEGSDRIEFLSTTLGGGFTSVTGRKVSRVIFADIYRVSYKLGERTGIYAEIQHGATDYERNTPLFDIRTIEPSLGFQWSFSKDTHLFGEVYYGHTAVDSNIGSTGSPPGNNFTGAFFGARGSFTEKLTGTAKAGYEFYQFENGGPSSAAKAGNSPVVETSLTYLLTERTRLMLDYTRRQHVSVEFSRSAYIADEISVSAATRLGSSERLRADVGGQFAYYAYDSSPLYKERNDRTWGVVTGVSWLFQTWLTSRLEYNFTQFRSDLPLPIDYDQHRVIISVALGY